MKKLSFSFKCGQGFKYGTLTLSDEVGVHERFKTTSSVAGRQNKFDWRVKGGLIPPSGKWAVSTTPTPMPNVKGVEGNFYIISPATVTCSNGVVRGDFGVHRDANVLGSLGCLVMPEEHFQRFEVQMKKARQEGIKSIKLEILYS